ncbi:hypothetical protein [Desulfosediminicola ganghwensis]|uniref:hypothetical protein n=1 Tax=Desulfosediminicola ganghwensis TaxID=2569540 RepID=UPI0010ABAA1E|nr:hypothetical protein [Desulfosediminicola ganghwensis]
MENSSHQAGSRKLFISLTALFILTVPIASPASDNSVTTYVVGGSNSFDLAQTGDLNQASSWQIGFGQDININQLGRDNTVGSQAAPVVQLGFDNSLDIAQYGFNNSVNGSQVGYSNTAIFVQYGLANSLDFSQHGVGNYMDATTHGYGINLDLSQAGNGNTLNVHLGGSNIELGISQQGGATATVTGN